MCVFVCENAKCVVVSIRLMDSDREPIQDVPAIYFVMPTDGNIRRICKVCSCSGLLTAYPVIIFIWKYLVASWIITKLFLSTC
jgi:hypothetical protein